jgi:transcriptional regulator with AbiEi antitoxin domain of type IV toxin-antitoxin system
MLKDPSEMKDPGTEVEREAADRIKALLAAVPFLSVEGIDRAAVKPDSRHRMEIDFLLRVKAHGRSQRLVCEVKSNGQPRHVRAAIDQLRRFFPAQHRDTYGVVIAPYLSPAAQQICREEDIGFLDFEGNCRLVFNGVFIERVVPLRRSTERRELKSIFAPKSAQVLRLLLRDPRRPWKVVELAERAGVSLGHISNVRTALIDREWAQSGPDGLKLTDPDALLDSWRDVYTRPQGRQLGFYTTLHGSALQQRLPEILKEANRDGGAMLASFSAAQWLAPYARTNRQYFYGDHKGLSVLQERLALSSPARGENVIVMQIKDEGLFRDAVEPVPHLLCTSPVQTYLDLHAAGERGKEAAEHLREEKLKWHNG